MKLRYIQCIQIVLIYNSQLFQIWHSNLGIYNNKLKSDLYSLIVVVAVDFIIISGLSSLFKIQFKLPMTICRVCHFPLVCFHPFAHNTQKYFISFIYSDLCGILNMICNIIRNWEFDNGIGESVASELRDKIASQNR